MASDSTLVACKKFFGAQFIESRKQKQILMNLLQKHFQSLLSEVNQETIELPKSKEVTNTEFNENNETVLCNSHFEIIDPQARLIFKGLLQLFRINAFTCISILRNSHNPMENCLTRSYSIQFSYQ